MDLEAVYGNNDNAQHSELFTRSALHKCTVRELTYQRQDLEGIANANLRERRQQSQHGIRWIGYVGLDRKLHEHSGVKRHMACPISNRGTALIYLRPLRPIYPASHTPSRRMTKPKNVNTTADESVPGLSAHLLQRYTQCQVLGRFCNPNPSSFTSLLLRGLRDPDLRPFPAT